MTMRINAQLPQKVNSEIDGSLLHLYLSQGRPGKAIDLLYELNNAKSIVGIRNKKGETILYLAAKAGETELVRALLLRGEASVHETVGPDTETALHAAAREGHAEIVYLLCTTPGCDPNQATKKGQTPLLLAVTNKRKDVISALIMFSGASVQEALHEAMEMGDMDIFRHLCSQIRHLDMRDKDNFTPLGKAVLSGNLPCARILYEAGANVHAKCGKDCVSLLYIAAENDQGEMVRWLTTLPGVDVNQKERKPLTFCFPTAASLEEFKKEFQEQKIPFHPDQTDYTPLSIAAHTGSLNALEALLQAGADVNAVNGPFRFTALHMAIYEKKLKVAKRLSEVPGIDLEKRTLQKLSYLRMTIEHIPSLFPTLVQRGADINAKTGYEESPILHVAAALGKEDLVKLLLAQKGIIKNSRDKDQQTPLFLAVVARQLKVVDLLLLDGAANPNEVFCFDDSTVLHHAAGRGYLEIVRRICEDTRTNIHKPTKFGETAFDLAKKKGHTPVVDYLRSLIPSNPLEIASALLKLKKMAEAEEVLKTALRKTPHDVPLLIALGGICMTQFKIDAALKYYETAQSFHKEFNIEIEMGLGGCKMLLGTLSQAEAHLEKALKRCPNNDFDTLRNVQLGLAQVFAFQLKFPQALEYLHRVSNRFPNHPALVEMSGLIAELQGELPKAEKCFREGLIQNPGSYGWSGLGMVLFKQKKWEEAGKCYTIASKQDPENSYALSGLGDIELHLGRREASEKYYRLALQFNCYNPHAHAGQGTLALLQGDLKKADDHFVEAVRYPPPQLLVYVHLATIAKRQKKYKKAEGLLLEAIRIDSTCGLVYNALGDLIVENDPRKAFHYYQKAVEFEPGNIIYLLQAADLGILIMELKEAKRFYEKVLVLNPQNTRALTGLGQKAILEKNYDEAEKYFEVSLKVDRKNITTLVGLAEVARDQNQFGKGEQYIREALTLNPHYARGHFILGDIKIGQGEKGAAKLCYLEGKKYDPENLRVPLGLGSSEENPEEALEHLKRARSQAYREKNPLLYAILTKMAPLAQLLGKPEEARRYLEELLQLDPQRGMAANMLSNLFQSVKK